MTDIPDGEKWLGSPAQPDKQAKRQMIAIQRLPELLKRVAELEKQCRVTGVDVSADMLRVAEAKLRAYLVQKNLVLKNHDFRDAPLEGQYDRILVTFFMFNYLLTVSEQQQFLLNVRHSLATNGVMIIDLFYPQPLALPATSGQWQETVFQAEGQQIALRQRRRMVGNIEERIQIFVNGTHQDEIVTRRCYLSKKQAEVLLTQAGFQNLQVRAPQEEDRRIHQQFHDGGGDDAADHRRGDAFHHVRAGAVAPQNRRQAGDDDARGHGFRADALDRAVINGVAQVGDVAHPPFLIHSS
jgi:SAM-dependent methyltransferase